MLFAVFDPRDAEIIDIPKSEVGQNCTYFDENCALPLKLPELIDFHFMEWKSFGFGSLRV